MVITLFRHGITDENRRGAYIGWTNTQLSEQATFTSVDEGNVDLVFTSDLDRSKQSAKHLFPMKKAIEMSAFRELYFGSWECKTYDDLKHDEHYRTWITEPFTLSPPGGESFQTFSERIDGGFDKILKRMGSNRSIALVTHGGVIRYLLTKYAPTQRSFWDWKVSHGTGVELEWNVEELRRGERCISLQEVRTTENQNG